MLISLLFACRVPSPSPTMGDCAIYPDGSYDYGQVGVGSCLAGATELAFKEDDQGNAFLLLTNANPYVLFTGGSLMSLAWDSIDLSTSVHYISDLAPTTLDMPSFNGPIAITNQDVGLLGVRYSEDARTRVQDDHVYIVDLADPSSPTPLNIGPLGRDYITTKSDPVDVVVDNTTGLAFVANRTSHDISVIDTTSTPIKIVPPWPLEVLSEASFDDVDFSGSVASFDAIEDLKSYYEEDDTMIIGDLTDDVWSLSWIEGIWRLWLPEEDGYFRIDTTGDGTYRESDFGIELALFEQNIDTPFYLDGTMYYSDQGTIALATWDSASQSWIQGNANFLSDDLLAYSSPSWLIDEESLTLIYAVEQNDEWWIASADYDEAGNLTANASPVLLPEGSERISEPFVVQENIVGQWRLFYSVYDGSTWHIGQHRSPDADSWFPASEFSIPGIDVAAPVVSEEVDRFRMWYARGENGVWDIAYAESTDGESWVDFGVIYPLQSASEDPPRIALNAYPTSAFRLEGEQAGYQELVEVNTPYISDSYGWMVTPIAGQWIDTDALGADSAGGIVVSSYLESTHEAFLTVQDATGTQRIAKGTLTDELTEAELILESGSEASVFSPVVWQDDVGHHMLYALQSGEQSSIYLTTSTDGSSWSTGEIVLSPQESWESIAIVPTSVQLSDGVYTLLYSGTDGRTWKIGQATSTDGQQWTKEPDPLLDLGTAGSWDDSGIRDGCLLLEDGVSHLWYSGFDGDTWRIGYAQQIDDGTWERSKEHSVPESGLFHQDGSQHPVVWIQDDQIHMWYSGILDSSARVGRGVGSTEDKIRQIYRHPTLGDTLLFETHRGDEESVSIPLDTVTEDAALSGVGLTSIAIDEERGFLYAVSKLMPYIIVIDARDDSQGTFVDRNYLDIEAVLRFSTSSGAVGFRQVLAAPNGKDIFALNDSPESVFVIDASLIEDDAYADLIRDTQVGWLPAPLGVEDDRGERTRMSIGPGQMILHPNEQHLFVSNFNANSVSVYDLTLGPHGEEIAELPTNGENPYGMAISPDGNHLVVSNYTGEITDASQPNSTLSIFDVDPASTTYLQLLTQVVNQ